MKLSHSLIAAFILGVLANLVAFYILEYVRHKELA